MSCCINQDEALKQFRQLIILLIILYLLMILIQVGILCKMVVLKLYFMMVPKECR